MSDVLLKTVITFLAVYGLVELIKDIFYCFTTNIRNKDIVIVVKVKNAESNLEYTIRAIVWKTLAYTRGNYMPDILIVDLGSDDCTAQIAKKLCSDYSFIQYTTNELYNKAKNNTEE